MSRFIQKAINSIISLIVFACLCIAGIYAGYALYDNNRIYTQAQNVQEDMLQYKPTKDNKKAFEELRKINKDVCAWVTLDNTNIDYPVLYGEDNITYINRDVYGEFALAGSIFLDYRNDKNFMDAYSILYGHHMDNHKMFGDLDLYKEEKFFRKNQTGSLILPDRSYKLKIFAIVLVSASDDYIFDPTPWQNDMSSLITYVISNGMYINKDTIHELQQTINPQVLAFTTCSSEFTDARTIVLTMMEPE
ncbi:MAG: class B sortase [Holdemanella sp.]|nr:class B sortase [Holdemanella sp.]